jgi:adenylate cyclase
VNLELSLLSAGDLAKLLARLYPDRTFPDKFIEWIYRYSEGNPLYVNALLNQAEIWEGLNINKAAADEFAKYETSTSVLPGTLHHLIEKNLNRISKSEKIVVETASVVGRTFPVKLLAESADDQERMDDICYRLSKRNQLLCSAGIMDWPDGTQTPCYSFIHALHQQVTYNTIPPLRARRLHLEIGYRIEMAYQKDISHIAANLATHFERGRNYQKAVVYRQRAGEIAFERHAYQEVLEHIKDGLGLLPKTSDKFDQGDIELSLQIMLGYTLAATQGYASPEVESTFSRAHELCSGSKPMQKVMPVLFGLFMYYFVKSQFDEASEIGYNYIRIASLPQNGDYLPWAYALQCLTSWYQGDFAASAAYADKSVACYDPIRHQPLVQLHGMDAGLTSWGHKAMALCLMGHPDQACEVAKKSLTTSKKYSGPFMIATILTYYCAVHYFRRDAVLLECAVEELISLTNEHGIIYYNAIAEILRVWGLAVEGAAKDGLARVPLIIDAYRATGANLMVNYFLYLLADIYRLDNQPEQGLRVIDEALSVTKTTDARWIEGDLHRLKGDLYLMKSERSPKARGSCMKNAEACFKEALEVTRRQKAILFALRAASGLSRVMDYHNKRDDALDLLRKVYGQFEEGFDLPDLKDTRLLIEALSP